MDKIKNKCAIITGIYGQDGSLLAEYLFTKGYRVVGLVKRIQSEFRGLEMIEVLETDITDSDAMQHVFDRIRPDECYHLAAVHYSSEQTVSADFRLQMLRVNFLATQSIIDAILEVCPQCRFLYAGSSQMYTPTDGITIIDENTPYNPSSYYGITKVAGAQLVSLMRREKKLWAVSTILFNHESTRRSHEFLSRKVTAAVAEIYRANNRKQFSPSAVKLEIRDITACVDWSAATDFIRAMHMILQSDVPCDYVLGSGRLHSVEELLEKAFEELKLSWSDFVVTTKASSKLQWPSLQSNPLLAQRNLGWFPQKSFSDLIREMVDHDVHLQSDDGHSFSDGSENLNEVLWTKF